MNTYKVTYGIKVYADIYVDAESPEDAQEKLEADNLRFTLDNYGGSYNISSEADPNAEFDFECDFIDDDVEWDIEDIQEYEGNRSFFD